MYKLCYHVPESHLERTKAAAFAAGAGRVGVYEHCCWQVEGQGQFRPLRGSRPFIGKQGELATVREYRVEMICSDELIAHAVVALKRTHPYEEPSYQVWRLADY